MDKTQFGAFLLTRREALQPEDVGLTRGPRRRTSGLRREEVADLAGMSSDYYARLERGTGPQPSEQMVAAIARGLRLSLAERDHLFLLAGHAAPRPALRGNHISPGLMRVLDRLADTPAQIMGALGETLVQTPPAVALLGDQTHFTGPSSSVVYRWFTDAASRSIYPPEDHGYHSRVYVAEARKAAAAQGAGSPAAFLAESLVASSSEFASLWKSHEVGLFYTDEKRITNAEVGELTVHCQILLDPDQQQRLLVFTATPGSASAEKLELLGVIGRQVLAG